MRSLRCHCVHKHTPNTVLWLLCWYLISHTITNRCDVIIAKLTNCQHKTSVCRMEFCVFSYSIFSSSSFSLLCCCTHESVSVRLGCFGVFDRERIEYLSLICALLNICGWTVNEWQSSQRDTRITSSQSNSLFLSFRFLQINLHTFFK